MALKPKGVREVKANLTTLIQIHESDLRDADVRFMQGMHTIHIHGTPAKPKVHIVTYVPDVSAEEKKRLREYAAENALPLRYDVSSSPHRIRYDLLKYIREQNSTVNEYADEIDPAEQSNFAELKRIEAVASDILKLPPNLRENSALVRIISPSYQSALNEGSAQYTRVRVGPWKK